MKSENKTPPRLSLPPPLIARLLTPKEQEQKKKTSPPSTKSLTSLPRNIMVGKNIAWPLVREHSAAMRRNKDRSEIFTRDPLTGPRAGVQLLIPKNIA